MGSKLVNVLYILDEPSIGLHQRDNQRLIDSLKQLRDIGNSVIVVEHDEDMMRQADYVIDIGPKAGRLGGEIVFEGTPAELLKADTLTAKYLRGELSATLTSDEAKGDEAKGKRLEINLLEVNTTPGMTATSFIPQQVRAAGLDIAEVLRDIIEDK